MRLKHEKTVHTALNLILGMATWNVKRAVRDGHKEKVSSPFPLSANHRGTTESSTKLLKL